MNILYRVNKLRAAFIVLLSAMSASAWAQSAHHEHAMMHLSHHDAHAIGDAGKNVSASELTLSAKLSPQGEIKAGKPTTFSLMLSHSDGSPVTQDELAEEHTERVHLLIVDPSVSDYHHEHPQPTEKEGEYVFSITPKKSGDYLVFVDVKPEKTQRKEYLPVTVEGFEKGITANQNYGITIRASEKKGNPLRSVVGTFSQMVNFN